MKFLRNMAIKYWILLGGTVSVIAIIITTIVQFQGQLEKERKAKADAIRGELNSLDNEDSSGDLITLKIGGASCNYSKSKFKKGVQQNECINMYDFAPATIKLSDNKLMISSKIFDKEGKIVCEILDNEWIVNPNNIYLRNYSNDAIEVIDQNGNIALSVQLLNENTISLQGIFNSPGKCYGFAYGDTFKLLEYYPLALEIYAQHGEKPFDERYREEASKIKRIFSYSGTDYLGKKI